MRVKENLFRYLIYGAFGGQFDNNKAAGGLWVGKKWELLKERNLVVSVNSHYGGWSSSWSQNTKSKSENCVDFN